MEELELQQKKEELIARIPLLEPIHSPNYEEVMDQMNTLVWEEMEDPMTMAPGASCKTASGVYNIFATDATNGLAKEQLMRCRDSRLSSNSSRDSGGKLRKIVKEKSKLI